MQAIELVAIASVHSDTGHSCVWLYPAEMPLEALMQVDRAYGFDWITQAERGTLVRTIWDVYRETMAHRAE